jgi:hypothetical protein
MTRDEIISLRLKFTSEFTKQYVPALALREMYENEIDFCIAAGMLKLDEPKTGLQKLSDALGGIYTVEAIQIICRVLDAHGLKIIEK